MGETQQHTQEAGPPVVINIKSLVGEMHVHAGEAAQVEGIQHALIDSLLGVVDRLSGVYHSSKPADSGHSCAISAAEAKRKCSDGSMERSDVVYQLVQRAAELEALMRDARRMGLNVRIQMDPTLFGLPSSVSGGCPGIKVLVRDANGRDLAAPLQMTDEALGAWMHKQY